MHARHRIAQGHGSERVAVIGAAKRHETAFFSVSCGLPELHGHLHGRFHGHGTGIGEKKMLKTRRQQPEKTAAELHGRLVRQPAEHDVRKFCRLLLHRAHKTRTAVAVHPAPPRRHAVHERRAVRKKDPRARSADDFPHGQRMHGRRVRMPQVRPVEGKKLPVAGPRIPLFGKMPRRRLKKVGKSLPHALLRGRKPFKIRDVGKKRHAPPLSFPGKTFGVVGKDELLRLRARARIGMRRRHGPAEHHACRRKSGMLQRIQRKQGMIETAQTIGHDEDHGQTKTAHEIEHALLFVQGHVKTARAFKKRHALLRRGPETFLRQRLRPEKRPLHARRKMGRTGHAEGMKRHAPASGLLPERDVGSFPLPVLFRAARLHGLHRKGRDPRPRKCAQKSRRHRGLARVGVRAGHEKGVHRTTPRVRIMARSASKAAPEVVR